MIVSFHSFPSFSRFLYMLYFESCTSSIHILWILNCKNTGCQFHCVINLIWQNVNSQCRWLFSYIIICKLHLRIYSTTGTWGASGCSQVQTRNAIFNKHHKRCWCCQVGCGPGFENPSPSLEKALVYFSNNIKWKKVWPPVSKHSAVCLHGLYHWSIGGIYTLQSIPS